MNARPIVFAAAAMAASFAVTAAGAQQAAPPPPAFAPSDLTPAGVRAMAANCAGCHGTEGRAVAGKRDLSLAGYPRESFVRGMTMYRDGTRKATLMHQVAKGYTDEEIAALAEYFSKQRR